MTEVDQSPVQITESSVDELRQICRQQPGALFAIVDACDEPRVPAKVLELGNQRAVSLYRGKAERDYWAIAPYLIQVDEQLLNWIVDNLWNDPWGFFVVTTTTELNVLRKHFREFLMVEDEDGQELYFRYYDPRVLPQYLGTCSAEESELFFGPIDSFFLSKDDSKCIKVDQRVL